jgi:hypothetical protein
MNINTLLEGASEYKVVQNDAKKLADKWTKTGLLEGRDLKHAYDKNNMAIILESQAKQLLSEASQTGTGAFFTAGQGEQWAGVALPLVRKIFAEISAKEFVSVQPMTLPSGLVFFLEFKYGTQRPNFTTTTGRFPQGASMYGITSGSNHDGGTIVDATGGLYGVGRFGYSSNDFTANVTAASASIANFGELDFNSAFSSSYAANTISKLTVASAASNLANFDANAIRAFSVSGSGSIKEANLLPQLTNYNAATDVLTMYFQNTTLNNFPVTPGTVTVYYQKQPTDRTRGDFEDASTTPLTGSNAIPEVNVDLRSEPITAKTRKLKGQWTPEFSQDLNAYQSLDAEAELTSILSEYIAMEIDLEILDMLITNAATIEYWSALPGTVINGAGTAFGTQSLTYTSQGAWFQTLGTKIQKVSNIIHQKTLRGGANFMVCSPTVATILESIPGYAADTNGDKMEFAMGVQKVGQLNSRFKVYKNPYMTENFILLGFRGSQFLETGAVYAPYIPLIMTPLVYDPVTFTPRKGLMTRYAKKIVRPEFYGGVLVADLQAL